jgi:type II secretory pathway component PulF
LTSFNYRARDKYGVLVSGRLEGESSKAIAVQLARQGFSPISIAEEEEAGVGSQIEELFSTMQKVRPEDLVVFTRQLASTLEAGVPLINSLDAVAEQIRNRKFRVIVLQVKKDIESGSTFSDALLKHQSSFSPLITNMIRGGEKAGILPQVLDRVSTILEKDIATSDKIKAATRYPMIVLFVLISAFIILTVYVIPKFVSFFAAFKAQLPLPTRILIGTNYVLTTYWYWAVGVISIVAYIGYKIFQTERGHYNWDRFILSTPVFGPLYSKIYLSRFSRMLSAMLGSGIPILEAMTVTAATVENKVISRVIIDIREDVSRGKSLTEPMRGSRVFPPIAISMVAIGEKAGSLEKMLDKTADYFDREIDYTIANLTPLIEPLMIFGLGVIVLIFALGIFLPMWELIRVFKTT